MNRTLIIVCVFFLGCIMACDTAWCQATAQISGTVKDPSGAALAAVQVTATQTQTGITRSTTTGETGSYVLSNLPLGPYRLEVSTPGFRKFVQTGIVLQVDDNQVVNPALAVGQVTEQVEVEANAAQVETRNTQVSQVIENERILELPLNGRQVTDLIELSGAATQNPNFTGSGADRSAKGSVPIVVAGGFVSSTVYLLDGAMHNDPWSNLNIPLPFPDALQEFKLETGTQSSQAALYSGALVTAVTKSGTNQFHGDLFEFVRNDLFNATSYFSTSKSTLKRNQFGGVIGGPIKKDKLFFFGGFQETILRQDPADQKGVVPTAAMLAGDFSALAPGNPYGCSPVTLKGPVVNYHASPALLDSASAKFASMFPQPQDQCGDVTYGVRTQSNQWQLPVKVDFQLSSKQSIFGRYLGDHYFQPNPYSLTQNLLASTSVGFDNFAQSLAFGDTYVISSNKVNSYRLVLNRTAINRTGGTFVPSLSALGISGTNYNSGEIQVIFGSSAITGANYGPTNTSTIETSDDLSIVKGTHQITLGGSLAQWRSYLSAQVFSKGYYTFSGSVTGNSLADFVLGDLSSFMQAPPNQTDYSQWYLGAYAADTWKATPKLTLNYGLRWEPWFPQVLRNGIISNFSESLYASATRSSVFSNAPFGFQYPGDPGFPGANCSPVNCTASGMNKDWRKVAPRMGLAWDPKGDGNMSVRAGFSVGYDVLTGTFYSTFINAPWNPSIIVNPPTGGLLKFENPYANFPGGNPFPIAAITKNAVFPSNSNYFSVPADPAQTVRYSWSLSIQRQLGANGVLTASYIGNHASHAWTSVEQNPGIYIPGVGGTGSGQGCINPFTGTAVSLGVASGQPCSTAGNLQARRYLALKYPTVTGVPIAYNDKYLPISNSGYNGLLLSIQQRVTKNFSLNANYTWAHCLSGYTASQSNGGGTPGTTTQSPTNPGLDYGNCDFDRRQIFNLSSLAGTPQFSNSLLRKVGSGWNLSLIYKKATGVPVNITDGCSAAACPSLTGVQAQRPNQVLSNVYGNGTITNFWNPAAFALAPTGSLGNLPRNAVYGPGSWQFDTSLFRDFKLHGESQKLEARLDLFNVLNSLEMPGYPVATLVTQGLSQGNNFGQINSTLVAGSPRIMQFALKILF